MSNNTHTPRQKAILLVAVSSEEQAKAGKASIPKQLENGQARAELEGWDIVDTLISDGHSRDYVDIYELAKDANRKGIDAWEKLIYYLKHGGFDVLWCQHGDRLGRTQTIVSFIAESIRKLGLQIYAENHGYVSPSENMLWNMVNGYTSTSYINELKRKARIGKTALIKQGIPVRPVIRTHYEVRDPKNGKKIGIELDQSCREEFKRLAQFLIYGNEGKKASFHHLEPLMYYHYGYGRNGEPYPAKHYYRLLTNPVFWGHVGERYSTKIDKYLLEDGHPLPDDCIMEYNVHEPVYTGELYNAVKRVMFERFDQKGRRRQITRAYSGLFVCHYCQYSMAYSVGETYSYLRCSDAHRAQVKIKCYQHKYIPTAIIDADMKEVLQTIIDTEDVSIFTETDERPSEMDIETSQKRIDDLTKRINTLIELQLDAPSLSKEDYRQKIEQTTKQREIETDILSGLKAKYHLDSTNRKEQDTAIHNLIELGYEGFKAQPEHVQNSVLRQILQDSRIVVDENGITGIVKKRKKPTNPRHY